MASSLDVPCGKRSLTRFLPQTRTCSLSECPSGLFPPRAAGRVAYKTQTHIAHCSGGWTSEIRAPPGSRKGSLVGYRWQTSCCGLKWQENVLPCSLAFSYKGTNPIREGPTLMA